MTAVLVPSADDPRAVDVARRVEQGETQESLAQEYGVSRMTIWRWRNAVLQRDLPALVDREQWRAELAATLADRIRVLSKGGDDRALVMLIDRIAKLGGLDHSDKINEALVRIEAQKLDLMAEALSRAMADAGVTPEQRVAIGDALDTRLAELESA